MNIHFLVDEFCHHKKYLKGVSVSTLKRYRSAISYFIKIQRIEHIEEVSKESLRAFFLYGGMERNWRPTTYRTYHMTLHTFLKWCVKEKYILEDLTTEIAVPFPSKNLPKALSKDEAKRILNIVQSLSFENYHFERQVN